VVRVKINRAVIVDNYRNCANNPPIVIEKEGRTEMAFEVELIGPARVVYWRGNPMKAEAQLWIECADAIAG
jgi:hypothetical protein